MASHEKNLEADLATDEFKHGEIHGFWSLVARRGMTVYVDVSASDERTYLASLDCSSYGDQAILCRFVDRETLECCEAAWPRGDSTFQGWVKSQAPHLFICWDQDRAGIQHHQDWAPRQAWKKPNQIVAYLDFLRGLLHRPECGYTPAYSRLRIPAAIFRATLAGLRDRSCGWRESAALWAGTVADREWNVSRVYFHHELGDDRGGPLSLELPELAKFQLYETLAQEGLRLVALIHTHPGSWVGLSQVDEANQVSSRQGFWSLVVPNYGQEPWEVQAIGVHVRAAVGWRRLLEDEVPSRVLTEE